MGKEGTGCLHVQMICCSVLLTGKTHWEHTFSNFPLSLLPAPPPPFPPFPPSRPTPFPTAKTRRVGIQRAEFPNRYYRDYSQLHHDTLYCHILKSYQGYSPAPMGGCSVHCTVYSIQKISHLSFPFSIFA